MEYVLVSFVMLFAVVGLAGIGLSLVAVSASRIDRAVQATGP